MSFLRLFSRFILRALLREKLRSLVAVLGVALGVAVMVAIRLANTSATDTFRAAVDSVSGSASLTVRGAAGRFDELRLPELAWLREYGQLSPVIDTYAMYSDGVPSPDETTAFPRGELLQVLGVDVLLDFPLRDYQVLRVGSDDPTQSARDALRLLDDPASVILTEKFLRRHALRVGDSVGLTFGSRRHDFKIRGVLLDRGPARTLDGNFALMDIAAAQLAADRLGLLDRVDVMLRPEFDADEILALARERLGPGLVAELPNAGSGRADTMIAAFQFNLAALSAVALIVGLFLIYNTVGISVAARRGEIGMLQAVGASSRTVLALFLTEAAGLAMVGLVLGLPAGRLLAQAAVAATAQTVETFYIAAVAETSASQLRLSGIEVAVAILTVIPLALVAAWLPAREAAAVQPIEAVRGLRRRFSRGGLMRLAAAGLACLAVAWVLTLGRPIGGRPLLGYLAEMVLMIGGALLTPLVLAGVCRTMGWVIRPLGRFRTEFHLAAANLLGDLPRISVAVAALGVSLSMMIAIAVMVGSFRETVVYWLDSSLSAELSIKPVMQTSAVSEDRLSPRAVEVIAQDPDVAETVWYSARQVPYRDRTIRLAVTEARKALERQRILFKSPPRDWTTATPREHDRVLVSESFSLLFAAQTGDLIELPTPIGPATLEVAGVYYDYASNQGTVMMDVNTYRRYYARIDPNLTAQHLSVYLQPGADAEIVRDRILTTLGDDEQVYCVTNHEVRDEALNIFESTFTVTYALEFIAILVAGLGVATTLITLIYQRQRDIGLLNLIGGTARQIRRVIVFEAVMLGIASQVMGTHRGNPAGPGTRVCHQRSVVRVDDPVPPANGVSAPVLIAGRSGLGPVRNLPGDSCRWRRPAQDSQGTACVTRFRTDSETSLTASLGRGIRQRKPVLRSALECFCWSDWCWSLVACRKPAWNLTGSTNCFRLPWTERVRKVPSRVGRWPTLPASLPFQRTTRPIPTTASSGGTTRAISKRRMVGEFGYQLTFFRTGIHQEPENPSRWAVRDLYTAHFAVSDVASREHRFAERNNRRGIGLADAAADHYEVYNGDWQVVLDGDRHHLQAATADFAIDVTLTPQKTSRPARRTGSESEGSVARQCVVLLLVHEHGHQRLRTVSRPDVRGRRPELDGPRIQHEFSRSRPGGLGLVCDPVGRRHGVDAVPDAKDRRDCRSALVRDARRRGRERHAPDVVRRRNATAQKVDFARHRWRVSAPVADQPPGTWP